MCGDSLRLGLAWAGVSKKDAADIEKKYSQEYEEMRERRDERMYYESRANMDDYDHAPFPKSRQRRLYFEG
jgi:hypothetical protein